MPAIRLVNNPMYCSESEILKHVIANIETTTLLGLKRIMKNYFLDKYSYFCHIPDCYICGLT